MKLIAFLLLLLAVPAQALTVLDNNSSTTPLNASTTFTGTADKMAADSFFDSTWFSNRKSSSVVVAVLTDQDGTLYLEQSPDGTNWDSSLSYDVAANTNEVHRLTVTRQYFRVRFTNTSESNQTFFRLQSMTGDGENLAAPANLTLGQDSDALVVRTLDPSIELVAGKRAGWSYAPKLGLNSDVDSGSLPEDVIDVGGTYSGFPVSTVEKLECFSSDASDTGELTIGGILDSVTDTQHGSETITLSGTTPVDTTTDVWRAHTMRYDSGSATTFNAGTITCRHTTTTSNVFLTISPGRSQSNFMVFTCPYEKTCWIKSLQGEIRRGTSVTVDGALWFRTYQGSPRYRRPFTIGNNAPYKPPLFGAIRLPGRSDLKATILNSTSNNVNVTFGAEIVMIED